MSRRLIDYDPQSRIAVWHEYDSLTDTTTIAEIQDVEPALESNKAAQNAGDSPGMGHNEAWRRGVKENMVHVATIPNSVIMKWQREKGINVFNKDHRKAVLRLLNDPEWRYLRVATGRV